MNFKENEYLCMFSGCIPVKGFAQSVIYDTHRHNYFEVPNSLVELMGMFPKQNINTLFSKFEPEEQKVLQEYIHFLLENDIAFICEDWELPLYPPLSLEWDAPYPCTNAIVECKQYEKDSLFGILEQLENLFCINIQLNFYSQTTADNIDEIMESLLLSKVKTVTFHIPYYKELEKINWTALYKKHKRIFKVVVYNSPKDHNQIADKSSNNMVLFIRQNVSAENCGQIHRGYFTLLPSFFYESQKHNTCLNRKLCIDVEGNIKNCPSMEQSFGNIKDTKLQEAIEKQGFNDLWFIHKDKIEVCKDCEFRHMCSDCRCYIKNTENIYSQPAKCTYNPYICKWQGEANYVPVEECGTYAKETGFVPNHEKIAQLNKAIWAEN